MIHPKIQKRSTLRKLIQAYQAKLATNHQSTCPFRLEAELCLLPPSKTTTTNTSSSADENFEHETDSVVEQQQVTYSNLVPHLFSSILPKDVWNMVELPEPLPYLQNRFHELNKVLVQAVAVEDGDPPDWELPTVALPEDVLLFGCEQEKGDQTSSDEEGDGDEEARRNRMLGRLAFDPKEPYTARGYKQANLLSQLDEILRPHQDDTRAQTRAQGAWEALYEGIAALALFGWIPAPKNNSVVATTTSDETSQDRTFSLQCPVCLASLEFNMLKYDQHHSSRLSPVPRYKDSQKEHSGKDDSKEAGSPAKKRRKLQKGGDEKVAPSFNPLHTHRYHCPYVVGFPKDGERKGTPIWQTIASKVFAQAKRTQIHATPASTEDENDAAEDSEDGDAKVDRILQLLRSAVSPRPRHQGKKNEYDLVL